MCQEHYQYRNVQIWGESTYEKYGVMKLLQSIDAESSPNTDVSTLPSEQGVKQIHIYCLSDSPLLGWSKHLDAIRKKHDNKNKVIVFVPAAVPRASIGYMNNISVIPYARTLLRMRLLLKAALYTDRYNLIQKAALKGHRGKYIFHQTLNSRNIGHIAKNLKISLKTAYAHREKYSRKMLGFKHQQIARIFFIGCADSLK